MGSDLCEREQRIIELVSIHAPAWGATGFSSFFSWSLLFQPTLPHGERQSTRSPKTTSGWFQPTLPHGERLLTHDATLRAKIVSIHAPAWGATRNKWKCNAGLWFQPTLPHGERRKNCLRRCTRNVCFNPRSRMGSDMSSCQVLTHLECFNPRSRMGSDIQNGR